MLDVTLLLWEYLPDSSTVRLGQQAACVEGGGELAGKRRKVMGEGECSAYAVISVIAHYMMSQ